jgi:formylglycine-generating enzyme required for sulfatase activity
LDSRSALPRDTVLDANYRIDCVIGSGGFGITYAAEEVRLGTRVAIKEYYPADFGDRDATMSVRPRSEALRSTFEWGRTRFLEEARTLARFMHPGIVRVTRVFEANATAYMVMDLEKGPSLEEWLHGLGRPPSQQELDRIVAPLLDALATLHAANFLHRDIAPDNIVIRTDGTPVLLDFGAARRAVAAPSRALTGVIKSGYSPHEQYATDGRLQGPWSDLYALGATLYRAVTGRPPEEATLRTSDDRMPSAAHAGVGGYRASFLAAIDQCLKVTPADRPQSVAELREALLGRADGGIARTAAQTVSRRAAARRRWIAAAGIVAAAGGAFGGFEYAQRPALPGAPRPALPAQSAPSKCPGIAAPVAGQRRCLQLGEAFNDCDLCPEMVVVPAGSFMMGSAVGDEDEKPVHRVTIAKAFAVGKFEVTFAEWDACVLDGGCSYKPSDRGWGRGRRPVIGVSWEDATSQYLPWISREAGSDYRLLSEAEWEYAARAGTTTRYAHGPTITRQQAQFSEGASGSLGGTVEVGSFTPNAFGLYDMHGNVWEWVEDCWHETYADAPAQGEAWIASCSGEARRVRRGGSFYNVAKFLSSAFRAKNPPAERVTFGFRVARSL